MTNFFQTANLEESHFLKKGVHRANVSSGKKGLLSNPDLKKDLSENPRNTYIKYIYIYLFHYFMCVCFRGILFLISLLFKRARFFEERSFAPPIEGFPERSPARGGQP